MKGKNETISYLDIVICTPNNDRHAVAKQYVIDKLKIQMPSQIQNYIKGQYVMVIQCLNHHIQIIIDHI